MVAEVEFHTGLGDPFDHACRLLRKALRQGQRVLLATPRHEALSARLWSFEAREFPAHARPGAAAATWARSPVWLVAGFAAAPAAAGERPTVWINLGAEPPEALDGCERLVELVGADTDEAAAGRARWRAYRERGLIPVKRFDGATAEP